MPIKIKVRDMTAIISNGKWKSEDDFLAEILRLLKKEILNYTPWPDYTLAEMACKALGGKIIEAPDPPEYVEGRVY